MRLKRVFFLRPPESVARDLLGKSLFFRGKRVVIIETEAYGVEDPACHAFRGETPRNRPMFRQGGWSYVYFIYGMHFCFNVVTGEAGIPSAVLIRAGFPVNGTIEISKNRGRVERPEKLLSGPGNFCRGLGIGVKENDLDLCEEEDFYFYEGDTDAATLSIRVSSRVGISKGQEKPWRFFLEKFHQGNIISFMKNR